MSAKEFLRIVKRRGHLVYVEDEGFEVAPRANHRNAVQVVSPQPQE